MSFDVDRSVTSDTDTDTDTDTDRRTNIDLGRGSYTIAPKGAMILWSITVQDFSLTKSETKMNWERNFLGYCD